MNEYQQQQDEQDMVALKAAVPEWKSQPLTSRDTLQDDVQKPMWNKLTIDQGGIGTAAKAKSSGDLEILVAANGVYSYGFIVINVTLTP